MSNDVVKYLVETRTLLSQEKSWCQHKSAKNKFGESVLFDSDVSKHKRDAPAVSWCLYGAVARVTIGVGDFNLRDEMRAHIRAAIGGEEIAEWNDKPTRTQEEVVAMLSAAIRIAKNDAECPHCEKHATISIEKERFKYGSEIPVELEATIPVYHCSECNFSFTDRIAEEIRTAAVNAYKKRLT